MLWTYNELLNLNVWTRGDQVGNGDKRNRSFAEKQGFEH